MSVCSRRSDSSSCARRRLLTAIDLGHQERSLTVSVSQSLPHALLALAPVVIPTVVEKVDAPIDGAADEGYTLAFILLLTNMVAAQAYHRYHHAGPAEATSWYGHDAGAITVGRSGRNRGNAVRVNWRRVCRPFRPGARLVTAHHRSGGDSESGGPHE